MLRWFSLLDLADLLTYDHLIARECLLLTLITVEAVLLQRLIVLVSVAQGAQSDSRLFLKLDNLLVTVMKLQSEFLPLELLRVDFLFGSAFIFIQSFEDVVTTLTVLINDSVINDLVDALLWQIVELLPIGGCVKSLVLD